MYLVPHRSKCYRMLCGTWLYAILLITYTQMSRFTNLDKCILELSLKIWYLHWQAQNKGGCNHVRKCGRTVLEKTIHAIFCYIIVACGWIKSSSSSQDMHIVLSKYLFINSMYTSLCNFKSLMEYNTVQLYSMALCVMLTSLL